MSDTLFDGASPAEPKPAWPPTAGQLDRAGAMLPKNRWQHIIEAVRVAEVERQRMNRQYWSFEAYDGIFAAASGGDGKAIKFLLRPLVALKARYDRARQRQLSPFQFFLEEQRFRADVEARDRRQDAEHIAAMDRSKQKAYRAMVEEAALKERARRDGREQVDRERGGKPGARVARPSRAQSSLPAVTHDDGEPEYLPPDPF